MSDILIADVPRTDVKTEARGAARAEINVGVNVLPR